MILAVAQFDGSNLPRLRIKPEVVVQTPPVVAQTFLNFETGHNLVIVTGHVGDLDTRQEVSLAVGIVCFREHPGQLEASLDDNHRFVPFLKTDRRIEV